MIIISIKDDCELFASCQRCWQWCLNMARFVRYFGSVSPCERGCDPHNVWTQLDNWEMNPDLLNYIVDWVDCMFFQKKNKKAISRTCNSLEFRCSQWPRFQQKKVQSVSKFGVTLTVPRGAKTPDTVVVRCVPSDLRFTFECVDRKFSDREIFQNFPAEICRTELLSK